MEYQETPVKFIFYQTAEDSFQTMYTDGDYYYTILKQNFISKFDMATHEIKHKWPVPMNAPFRHHMAVINGKIYYCNVNNNEVIIFPTSKESSRKEFISLGRLEKPIYIIDNTPYQDGTVIIAGPSGVGKFPIIHGYSEPNWLTRIEHARGISVDSKGLIYVARCQPSAIYLLSQQTGK